MGFVVRGCYPESLYAFSLLLHLLCWGVSAASCHAGCLVMQGRTLVLEILVEVALMAVQNKQPVPPT
jgi:hypothetical protein